MKNLYLILLLVVYPMFVFSADLTADFEISGNAVGCDSISVSFVNKSIAGENPIVKYVWIFGDGDSSTATNPVHLYKKYGSFSVLLKIQDSKGFTKDAYIPNAVSVSGKPILDFFTLDPIGCTYPAAFTFYASIVSPSNSAMDASKYLWDFGDTKKSTLKSPVTNSYSSKGEYTVSFTATDVYGCKSTITKSKYIYVPDLKASFSTNYATQGDTTCVNDGVLNNQTVLFSNTSTGEGTPGTITWDLEGFNTYANSGQTANYQYTTPGTYNTKMRLVTIVKSKVCTLNVTKAVHAQKITPNLSSDTAWVCSFPVNNVQLRDKSVASSPITIWNWTVGANSQSVKNPIFNFLVEADTLVKLKVETKYGCKAEISKSAFTNRKAIITLTADTSKFCIPYLDSIHVKIDSVQLYKKKDAILSYKWVILKKNSSGVYANLDVKNQAPPFAYNFKDYGDFLVRLVIKGDVCGYDSGLVIVKAGDTIHARITREDIFSRTLDKACVSEELSFIDSTTGAGVAFNGIKDASAWEWEWKFGKSILGS